MFNLFKRTKATVQEVQSHQPKGCEDKHTFVRLSYYEHTPLINGIKVSDMIKNNNYQTLQTVRAFDKWKLIEIKLTHPLCKDPTYAWVLLVNVNKFEIVYLNHKYPSGDWVWESFSKRNLKKRLRKVFYYELRYCEAMIEDEALLEFLK